MARTICRAWVALALALVLVVGCRGSSSAGAGSSGGKASVGSSSGTGSTGYAAPHADFPQVPNHGGPILSSPQMYVINFKSDTYASLERSWAAWAVQSSWLAQVGADYGVGLGSYQGGPTLSTQLAGSVTNDDLWSLLDDQFNGGALPSPVPSNLLVMIFLPAGTNFSLEAGLPPFCTPGSLAGYHLWYLHGSVMVPYAVIEDCGANEGQPDPNALEIGASHELIEAATDPFLLNPGAPTDGYRIIDPDGGDPFTSMGDEVADLCDRLTRVYVDPDAGYFAQRIWSNSAAAAGQGDPCVPVPVGETFYAVSSSTSFGWVTPGMAATFSVNAWSSGPTQPWCVTTQGAPNGSIQPHLEHLAVSGSWLNGATASFNLGLDSPQPPGAAGVEWLVSNDCDGGVESIWPFEVAAPPIGLSCTLSGSGTDSCDSYGLSCDVDGGVPTCQLPGEAHPCLPSVGCQGSTCVDGGTGFTCGSP